MQTRSMLKAAGTTVDDVWQPSTRFGDQGRPDQRELRSAKAPIRQGRRSYSRGGHQRRGSIGKGLLPKRRDTLVYIQLARRRPKLAAGS